MTETLSIRIDGETKRRLDALSKSMNRSRSFLAAEAITAYVAAEEWQLGEIEAGLGELDEEQGVSHEKVAKWMATWGTPGEKKAPR
jgi:RHH-type transcriptional regulator, rel operon repressor / antitoxin RelB